MKSFAKKIAIPAAVIVAAAAPLAANAAGGAPADFEPIFTAATSQFTGMVGYAVSAVVVIWGGLFGFKIARRLKNNVG